MNIQEVKQVMVDADLIVTETEVATAIARMACEMTAELQNANPVLLCCMNGGLIFAGQLLTKLLFPLQIDYVHATRYGDATTGAEISWEANPQVELSGRIVVLLDDILDEGVTLAVVTKYCYQHGAKKVMTAVLIEKNHLRKTTLGFKADFTGIMVADRFLFGYGLDYKGYWRNAPGIYALKDH